MSTHTFTLGRGEDESWTVSVVNPDKTIPDLTNAKIWFGVKARIEDVSFLFMKRSAVIGGTADQIEILMQSGTTKGKLRIHVDGADTLALLSGTYWCEAFYEDPSGNRIKIVRTQEFVVEPSLFTSFPTS